MKVDNFIKGAVGELGASALSKALERIPALGPALAPRVLVSWLVAVEDGYQGPLPGIDNSWVTLTKSEEDSYQGVVTYYGDSYTFDNEPFLRVAAGLAVTLGVNAKMDPKIKASDLSALGKSIDKLVKAQVGGQEAPGKPAAPLPPTGFNEQKPQEKHKNKIPPIPGFKGSTGQPSIVAKGEIKVSKVELQATCEECGEREFDGERFKGCKCVPELAKSDTSLVRDGKGGWTLTFGQSWSHDSITVVCEAVKK